MIVEGSTLLLATRNKGKTKEFRDAFQCLGIHVIDLHEVEGIPEIEETGATFEENAAIKAKIVADSTGIPVLADDSGLCVERLGGAPGVYSARYAGDAATDADNNTKLLHELGLRHSSTSDETDREPLLLSAAQFVCSLVLYDPQDGSKLHAEGTVEGQILSEARGSNGFGYDPLFWIPSFNRSMAELNLDEKNAISHRGTAIRKLLAMLA